MPPTTRTERPDGRSQRWHSHKADRRTRVVAAAIAAISAQGIDVRVSDIAQRAGLTRSVVYRLFHDRADLDEHIRGQILLDLMNRLTPALTPQGTLGAAIAQAIDTYVHWIVTNPHLHQFLGTGSGKTALAETTSVQGARTAIAVQVSELFATALRHHAQSTRIAEPLAFGLVGLVDATINRWLSQSQQPLAPEELSQLLQGLVVNAITDTMRNLGLSFTADTPVQDLLRTTDT